MFKIRTASRRGAKAAASIAALLLLPLSLTACGADDSNASANDHGDPVTSSSSSLEGEYWNDVDRQLVITDDNSATFYRVDSDCTVDTDDVRALGTISDDGTQIVWSPSFDDYQYIGNDADAIEEGVTNLGVTEAGGQKILTINGYSFHSGDQVCN